MNREQITKFIFSTTNILKVQDFLQENQQLDPRQYTDKKQNNILHHLSFHDQKELIKLYVIHTRKYIESHAANSRELYHKDVKQQIAVWANQKNLQGFTPLLYASFNGHIQLIRYLEEIGANALLVNKNGLNVLHMAAQNNKVAPLIYFKERVDVNEGDQKGSTPLHWAAYNCSEQVTTYLLTLPNININARDEEGQTSLLLATMYGNTKIVRRLLLKGANRRIKSKKGELPLQVARENQFKNISKMLNDDYNCMDFFKFYYNVKLEYRPKDRSMTIPIVFLLCTFSALFIIHGLLVFKKDYLYILESCIIGPMVLFYISLLFPPKKQQKGNIALFLNQTRKICFECVRRKPKRSYHCEICKTCIPQYDHHCTWINNCVGKKNIARFMFFITFLVLSLGMIGIISVWFLLKLIIWNNQTIKIQQFIDFREKNAYEIQRYQKIVLFVLNMIISCFFFPVFLLLIVQIKNLLNNKTTYERIRAETVTVKEQLKGKNKKGPSLKNCKAMCSNTRNSFMSDTSEHNSSILEQQLIQSH